jgi:hypothetical protein
VVTVVLTRVSGTFCASTKIRVVDWYVAGIENTMGTVNPVITAAGMITAQRRRIKISR